jgi:photosystem II stability/assembly factor-like uncharacterized protein
MISQPARLSNGSRHLLLLGSMWLTLTSQAALPSQLASPWVSLGIPATTPTTINPSGTRQVFVCRLDGNRLYAGVRPLNLLYSENQGQTWSALPPDPGTWDINIGPNPGTFNFHPLNRDWLFFGSESRGQYLSRDRGLTWRRETLGGSHWFCTAFDPADINRLWAGTANYTRRSTDGGLTWTTAGNSISSQGHDTVAVGSGPNLVLYQAYIWTTGTIHKSTDGGTTWTEITNGIPTGKVTPTGYHWAATFDLEPHPAQPETLYACTAGNGFYRTTNGGALWAKPSTFFDSLSLYPPRVCHVHRTRTNHVIVGTDRGRVYFSGDAAATWANISDTLPTGNMPDGSFAISNKHLTSDPDNPDIIYLSRTNGLYRAALANPDTKDFTTWANQISNPAQRGPMASPAGDGLPNLAKYALALNPSVSTPSPVAATRLNNGTVRFTFPLSTGLRTTRVVIQHSTNLSSWANIATCADGWNWTVPLTENATAKTTAGLSGRTVTCDMSSAQASGRSFFRLAVELYQ